MIMKNKKNQRKQGKAKRVLLILLLVFVLLCAALAGTFMFLQNKGKKDLMNYNDFNVNAIDGSQTQDDGKTVIYKGRTYRLNENITSIACLGVDKEELMVGAYPGAAGQSDTNIVLAIDTANGSVTAINIPRDTMTDINVFDVRGGYVNTTHEQLCLAYAYGDGKKTSCENAVTSIERALFGMPVNSYISLDMDGIGVINDAIGGVTVTPNETFAGFEQGLPVTLHGDRTVAFVRLRGSDLNASLRRSERHVAYAKSFAQTAVSAAKKDFGTVRKLYNTTMKYCSTNVDLSKVTYLATTLLAKGFGGLRAVTLPGTMAAGEKYAEYTIDAEKAFEMILSIFYKEVI